MDASGTPGVACQIGPDAAHPRCGLEKAESERQLQDLQEGNGVWSPVSCGWRESTRLQVRTRTLSAHCCSLRALRWTSPETVPEILLTRCSLMAFQKADAAGHRHKWWRAGLHASDSLKSRVPAAPES